MYTITKQFHFSASHSLKGLAATHQCARDHGHNYSIELELSAEHLDSVGFVVDYGELDEFAEYIKNQFDHRNLNDCMTNEFEHQPGVGLNSTAENLARGLYIWCKKRWGKTSAVRVSETPSTWAEYRP